MKEYLKKFIVDRLPDLLDRQICGAEISSELYAQENISGCVDIFIEDAKKWLEKHHFEIICAQKYQKMDFGKSEIFEDYFCQPCICQCRVVLTYVDVVFNRLISAKYWNDEINRLISAKYWNDEIEITQEFLNEILENLDNAIDEAVEDLTKFENK